MKRILSSVLCVLMTASMFVFTANAQSYQPEVAENYISFDFNQVTGGIVNNVPNATVNKNVTIEGVNAVEFVPTPNAEGAKGNFTLDCYRLANYTAKVTVPDYKYVGVTYYYKTENPCYEGQLFFNILPNSNKAFSGSALSTEDIVTNKWTEAIFDFSETMKLSASVVKDEAGNPKNWLQQAHFKPFNNTAATDVPESDRFYVAKYTFYKKNPDPNATNKIRFDKGNPEATGEMADIEVKDGDKYTLPTATFTFPNAEFLGWKTADSEAIIPAGTEMICDGTSKSYIAAWKVTKVLAPFISLDFTEYEDGIVNHTVAGIVEHTERDGRNVVAIQPNPEYPEDKGKNLTVDGYSYKAAGIDLDYYKYCAVEYYYDSRTPIQNTKMYAAIMKNGNVLKNAVSAESDNEIVAGNWVIALFDFSAGIEKQYNAETEDHVMRQMHLRPLGSNNLQTLNVDDRVYISRIMFFQEKPDFQTHEAYMKGYPDGTFLPNGTITRAEACTVVARLLEKEEAITGTSAFADVAGHWAEKYIGFCEAKGLLKSYSGNFEPGKAITRAEFAELVYLTGLAKAADKAVTFTDVAQDHAKYTSIMAAASAGLINGYDNGNGTFSFKPDNTITRAEVVTIVNRARGRDMKTENLTNDILLVALDVDITHWAFANIAEATVPHVEWDGKWIYAKKDPVIALGEKLDLATLYKTDEGNAKVAELDVLEQKRIEEIRNTPNMDITAFGENVVYVSNSTGDDKNDGKTPATAVKTLLKANSLSKKGGVVLLKRGDMWRESLTAKAGTTYSAYGEGAKPVINGSPENAADPALWALVHKDDATGALIWQYKNTENLNDVGVIVLNDEGYTMKEVPSYVGGKFVVRGNTGKAYDWKTELDKNFEFVHLADSKVTGGLPDLSGARGPLYFRCDNGNPGKVFDSIEMNERGHGISIGGTDVHIDNICIKNVGSHGISSGTTKNLTVTNCEFGWIGGTIQTYSLYGSTDGRATRFGNGVEIYGGCDGYKVDNCYIWQNYDAGVTHQFAASSSGICTMRNIIYSNNVITDTVYSIEYFLGNTNDGGTYVRNGKNHLFEGNLLRRAGFGFGSTRPDGNVQTHIRTGAGTKNEFSNYVIRNNVFDRSVEYLIHPHSDYDATAPKMEGNIYIQGIGNKFFHYGKGHTANANLAAKNSMLTVLGDTTGQFYYVDTIPYWQFDYTIDKKVAVEADDTKDWGGKSGVSAGGTSTPATPAEPGKVVANAGESKEVVAPLLLRLAQDDKNKLYADMRASMNSEKKTDSDGTVYEHITFNNTTNTVLFDCHGLPKYSLESGAVYYKALIRTNITGKTPHITVYNMADKDGTKVGNGVSGTAPAALKGNGQWEEIIIKVTDFPAGAVTSTQIHFFLLGNTKGENLFKDGKLIVDNAYLDVAAWAAFPNLASAEAYDLAAAAKAEIK